MTMSRESAFEFLEIFDRGYDGCRSAEVEEALAARKEMTPLLIALTAAKRRNRK